MLGPSDESVRHREQGGAFELGARLLPGGRCSFAVWAPFADRLELELRSSLDGSLRRLPMQAREGGRHHLIAEGVRDADTYFFVFPDGRKRPDPRSLRQPEGVHGPSAVVDLRRIASLARPSPSDPKDPPRPPLAAWVIYELHVGTFTAAGTFDGVAQQLPYLRELGVNAIELMPVSPFPGSRNWGYDGVAAFGVQESYGGPEGLARLVRAAHAHGLAVILDVVYNHLGPEGNYLREFGPYFTRRHQTPWGDGINFDDEGSAEVRAWAIESALHWIRTFDIDGLRLDAVHAIVDDSPLHLVAELAAAVQAAGGRTVGESDLNDPVVLRPRPEGWGLDAQWSDDLHHALHALLTGERTGYYVDFGKASDVAKALEKGFVLDGSRHSIFRKGPYGKPAEDIGLERHVVCLQNHDQIGNRAQGDRIAQLVGLQAAKVGAAVLLLAPETPLLFMGEEYAAPQPFPYFTSHGDPQLARRVTEGRRHEFSAFKWQGVVPDPQAPSTFESAILRPEERERPPHNGMLAWIRSLLSLRHEHPALRSRERRGIRTHAIDEAACLLLLRSAPDRGAGESGGMDVSDAVTHPGGSAGEGRSSPRRIALIASFSSRPQRIQLPLPAGDWKRLLDSGDPRFAGEGAAGPARMDGEQPLDLPPYTAWIFESDGCG